MGIAKDETVNTIETSCFYATSVGVLRSSDKTAAVPHDPALENSMYLHLALVLATAAHSQTTQWIRCIQGAAWLSIVREGTVMFFV